MTANNLPPKNLKHLIIGAIGVVYGDIGTSPLYTVKECFSTGKYLPNADNVLGILSLLFWALTIIVSLKYVLLILRADNYGEGGILALMALTLRTQKGKVYNYLLMLGLAGAALFYGDAVITPAISVLSAIEGISVYSPALNDYVIPLTILILVILFAIQKSGTARLGLFFGPAMIIWFSVLAVLGIIQIIQEPIILKALNPYYAWMMFRNFGFSAFTVLGSVVLAVTGAEALYADMGHYGRPTIQRAWYYFVYPALILNYFGQGSLLLTNAYSLENPFYYLVPSGGILLMVILATAATIIASQAVISGIFSISWQAVQLGYLPRMRVIHTSAEHIGQVYVPTINVIICLLTILLVSLFQSSNALASAYGFAVTGIMIITTLLTTFLALYQWKWSKFKVLIIFSGLIIFDAILFGANTLKVFNGGWLPILIAIAVFAIKTTWLRGRTILNDQILGAGQTIKRFITKVTQQPPIRVPGAAVYMSSTPANLANSFNINFRSNKVLHEKVIFLSILTSDVPRVPRAEKVRVKDLGFNIYQVICQYGYKETPNITYIFEKCDEIGLCLDLTETTFFLSRGIPVASIRPHIARWREQLFIFLARNAANATEYYKIPHNRVVELGIRLKL